MSNNWLINLNATAISNTLAHSYLLHDGINGDGTIYVKTGDASADGSDDCKNPAREISITLPGSQGDTARRGWSRPSVFSWISIPRRYSGPSSSSLPREARMKMHAETTTPIAIAQRTREHLTVRLRPARPPLYRRKRTQRQSAWNTSLQERVACSQKGTSFIGLPGRQYNTRVYSGQKSSRLQLLKRDVQAGRI